MRRPAYPCKFGVHVNTAIKEYEHFVGHLVDTPAPTGDEQLATESGDWIQYELPLNLMVNNQIKSSLIHCHADDVFHMKGLSFHVEKQNSQFNPEVDYDDEGEPVPIDI